MLELSEGVGSLRLDLFEASLDKGLALAKTRTFQPYVEDINDDVLRSMTALVMENTRQEIQRMDEATRIANIGNFDKFAYPLVRAIFPNLIAQDIVTVQPMPGPSSLLFYLDYVYGRTKGSATINTPMFGAGTPASHITGPADQQYYTSEFIDAESHGATDHNANGALTTITIRNLAMTPLRATGVTGYTAGTAGAGANAGTIVPIKVYDPTEDAYATGIEIVNANTGEIKATFATAPAAAETFVVEYEYNFEGNDNLPELDLKLTSTPVQAVWRKLRARWPLEAAANLQALHGLSLESEVLAVMGQEIKYEKDREVIDKLWKFAKAKAILWDADRTGATDSNQFSWAEHKLSLVDAFQAGSNQIFVATKRNQANYIVADPRMCDVIETLPTFVGPGGTPDASGVQKVGVLNGRWTVFKDPDTKDRPGHFGTTDFNGNASTITGRAQMGYKSPSMLDAGAIYGSFLPLFATPTNVFDDFVGRKGMASAYSFKEVNPKFYTRVYMKGSPAGVLISA